MIPPISVELRNHQIEAYKKTLQAFGAWEGEEYNSGQHEHRVIAEQEIGKPLRDGEIAHLGSHKVGDAI